MFLVRCNITNKNISLGPNVLLSRTAAAVDRMLAILHVTCSSPGADGVSWWFYPEAVLRGGQGARPPVRTLPRAP